MTGRSRSPSIRHSLPAIPTTSGEKTTTYNPRRSENVWKTGPRPIMAPFLNIAEGELAQAENRTEDAIRLLEDELRRLLAHADPDFPILRQLEIGVAGTGP